MPEFTAAVRPTSSHAPEVGELLRRYPDLSPSESRQLLESFMALPLLDVALLTTDEKVRKGLDAFRRDHRSEFRPPFWQYMAFAALPGAYLAACAWALWGALFGA